MNSRRGLQGVFQALKGLQGGLQKDFKGDLRREAFEQRLRRAFSLKNSRRGLQALFKPPLSPLQLIQFEKPLLKPPFVKFKEIILATVRVGNKIPYLYGEFKFRVGVFTRKLPVETVDNWFWCRLAVVNKRNRTASAGVHCSVSTQGPLPFQNIIPIEKLAGFGFRVWIFTKKLPAETTIASGGNLLAIVNKYNRTALCLYSIYMGLDLGF